MNIKQSKTDQEHEWGAPIHTEIHFLLIYLYVICTL